jgi:preprotein translocase subunit SecF
MKTWNLIAVALFVLMPTVIAQNPIDALTGSIQEQMNTVGQQLQQKAVQHITEGNLTQEHISQELNATRQNLTEQAKEKLQQKLNQNLNLTPEQLQQKAVEEIKSQVSQKVQQPGFECIFALACILGTALIIRRKR